MCNVLDPRTTNRTRPISIHRTRSIPSSSSSSSHDKQFIRNTRVLLLHRFHRRDGATRVFTWTRAPWISRGSHLGRKSKNRDSPRGYRQPRRYRSACTRVHAISRARKWRNVRNKRLAGQRSGRRWLRAGPPASLLWGQWTGPHRVASRVEESPCVSRSHTRHTHTQQGRPPSSLPCTPTTAASIILLSWPLGPFYSHRTSSSRPTDTDSNRKISQWTWISFFFSIFPFFFVLSLFERGGRVRPCDSGLGSRSIDLKIIFSSEEILVKSVWTKYSYFCARICK